MGIYFNSFSQEEGKPTPHGIKLDFKLPTAISNKSFKGVMSGIADIDLAYQYKFKNNGLILSSGVKYGYWTVESSIFSGNVTTGKMDVLQPFLSFGYRSVLNDKMFFEYEFKTGYGWLFTHSNNCSDPFRQENIALEPKISFYYKSSELLYFGVSANYNVINSKFSPNNLCLTNFPGIPLDASGGIYQYFSIGFGFYAIIPSFK